MTQCTPPHRRSGSSKCNQVLLLKKKKKFWLLFFARVSPWCWFLSRCEPHQALAVLSTSSAAWQEKAANHSREMGLEKGFFSQAPGGVQLNHSVGKLCRSSDFIGWERSVGWVRTSLGTPQINSAWNMSVSKATAPKNPITYNLGAVIAG